MKRPQDSALHKTADVFLLGLAGVMLAPIVLVALLPVVLTLAALWPLLILPVLGFNRLIPRGEEQIDEALESIGRQRTQKPPDRAVPHPV